MTLIPKYSRCFLLFISLSLLAACGEQQSAHENGDNETSSTEQLNSDQDKDSEIQLSTTDESDLQEPVAAVENSSADKSFSEPTAAEETVAEETTIRKEDSLNADALLCQEPDLFSQAAADSVCRAISNRLASVSLGMCQAAELSLSGCESVNGFPIVAREFPPLPSRAPQGRILVIGGTHGDELTSVSIMFRWIEKLNKFHSGLFHWRMVPMLNPDGVLRPEATRTNENGVDLNRNLPTSDWDEKALAYWQQRSEKNPRRFPGQRAGSEPEVHWLIDEIERFQPDAIISVHAPYGMVDFDALLLANAPKSLGKLHLNLLGTYPGSLGKYAGINRDIPVITLELPHAWEMPSESESTRIWEDIVAWLKRNINQDQTTMAE